MERGSQHLFGYCERFSAAPGESLSFHVSCEGAATYKASLVQLRHGFTGAAGPGFLEKDLPSEFEGVYDAGQYICQPGSYVEITDKENILATPEGIVIEAYIFPTLPQGSRSGNFGAYHVTQNSVGSKDGYQTILGNWSETSQTGYALVLDEGKPTFVWGENGTARKLALDKAVAAYQWCRLTVRICATDRLIHLEQDPVDNIMNRCSLRAIGSSPEKSSAKVHEKFCPGEAPFRIGALAWHDGERWLALNAYNGKIGGLRIRRVIPTTNEFNELASWHFAQSNREDGLLLQDVIDQSGNGLHGRCYNTPTRGVTGHLFLGLNDDFRLAPDEYDAIHFHDDDITDAQWPASFDFKIPVEFSSGVYAVKLTDDNSEYYIPFFVRAGKIKRNVAVLFSTATYLAYANDRIAFEANGAEIIVSRTPIIDRADLTLQEHPEFGRSCYEIHGSFEFQVG